jgi:hypothetical protein
VPIERLAGLLGRDAGDEDFLECLADLEGVAVVLRDADHLVAPAPLRLVFREPLLLGPPAEELFAGLAKGDLHAMAARLGLPERGRSAGDVLAGLVAFLSDGAAVRELVSSAPAKTRGLLESMAARGSRSPYGTLLEAYATSTPDLRWAEERGLVRRPHEWSYAVEMPAEVGFALRGPGYRAPFHPRPPQVPTVEIAAGLVEREASVAITAAVERLRALADEVDRQPIGLLKTGGVGMREIRRLAKRLSLDEQEVRLWLEIAGEIGVLSTDDETAAVTERYDTFRRMPPAHQADLIIHGWLGAAILPTWRPPGAKQEPALFFFAADSSLQELRLIVLQLAGQVLIDVAGQARGMSSTSDFVAALQWFAPALTAELADGVIEAVWAEAQMLGLVAHGAPTSLGVAVTTTGTTTGERECPIRVSAGALVAPASDTGIFQADLTVTVPGTPSATLSDLLDSVADRESRGVAGTWRFSASSVRRALDGGASVPELEAALTEASQSGLLPQPLRYLLGDVARRHGTLRVRPAGCVIQSADETLLAEVAAASQLRPLRLWRPAPAVLISAASVAETLAQLRSAGYAPVEEGPNGELVIERRTPRRLASTEDGELDAFEPQDTPELLADELATAGLVDPHQLARHLLEQPADGGTPRGRRRSTQQTPADREEIDYLERLFKME